MLTFKGRKGHLVLLSGGLDSSVLLTKVVKKYNYREQVEAVHFSYGQRHSSREKSKACTTLYCLGMMDNSCHFVNLESLKRHLPCALTNDLEKIPEGTYQEGAAVTTEVPNRNMIFLSVAVGIAKTRGLDTVWIGAHGGDSASYPDCRPQWLKEMNTVCWNTHRIGVEAPFLHWDKGKIVSLGVSLGVDFRNTWSCYVGGASPCGVCPTCIERREAFSLAGINDPLDLGKEE